MLYSNQVHLRNSFGRFIAECEAAATATVLETAQEGANIAAAAAPKRTGRLAASIQPFLISRTSAVWGTSVKYAAPQEYGASPHAITAHVSFFWDKVGRRWLYPEAYERMTGFPGADPIHHPGNPAVHFMSGSARAMKPRMTAIAKKHYPG